MNWLSSESHQLPDGTNATLTMHPHDVAQEIGMKFQSVAPEQMEAYEGKGGIAFVLYPGADIDASVTLWLCAIDAEHGRKGIAGAARIAEDPVTARQEAREWFGQWFEDNEWLPDGNEYYQCLSVVQSMWLEVKNAKTDPLTEGAGDGGDSLGK